MADIFRVRPISLLAINPIARIGTVSTFEETGFPDNGRISHLIFFACFDDLPENFEKNDDNADILVSAFNVTGLVQMV